MSNDLIRSVQSCCESKSPLMLLSQQCIRHRLLKMYEMHTLKDTYELKGRSSNFILSLQRVSSCNGYWKLWTLSPLTTLICNSGGERLWPWIWHWHRTNVTYQLKHLVIKNKCIIANVMANPSPTQTLNPFKTLNDSNENLMWTYYYEDDQLQQHELTTILIRYYNQQTPDVQL